MGRTSAVGCWNTVDVSRYFFNRVTNGATFSLADEPDLMPRDSLTQTTFTV